MNEELVSILHSPVLFPGFDIDSKVVHNDAAEFNNVELEVRDHATYMHFYCYPFLAG